MTELVIATKNKGKLREIKELLGDLDLKITSLADYPDAPEIEEDGKTFGQNALKKAATIALYTQKLTLGEDSGIEVKALGNKPGIHSARFSGEKTTDKKNNLKLLRSLKNVPSSKRQARYRCYAALVDLEGIVGLLSGRHLQREDVLCETVTSVRLEPETPDQEIPYQVDGDVAGFLPVEISIDDRPLWVRLPVS